MLSRIARGICTIGREVERAQNVTRILEVNHKMHLERAPLDGSNIWVAISEAFDTGLALPNERGLYDVLVASPAHEYSVARCIRSARDLGREVRDHISEEMWLHLNESRLALADVCFNEVLRIGRSDFNRRIETFCDALYGLADDTMIHGPAWHFLRIGRFLERACMICRILDIKRKAVSLAPQEAGRPIDVHQWQALLRSLSGYEPYRRAYDARIVPARVFEFVIQRADFPRSLAHAVGQVADSLGCVTHAIPAQVALRRSVSELREELRLKDARELLLDGSLESHVKILDRRCRDVAAGLERAFFASQRAAPGAAASAAALVPQ
jgi:uncharacterized alpha-E superfamily protein